MFGTGFGTAPYYKGAGVDVSFVNQPIKGVSTGISFNVKTNLGSGQGMFSPVEMLKTFQSQLNNLTPLLRRIENDIYNNNQYVFESYGLKPEGEGVSWPFNGRWWSSFKSKYHGQTVENPFSGGTNSNDFFKEISVTSTDVCVLTGRLKRALIGGGEGMESDMPGGTKLVMKCTVPYLKMLQQGYTFERINKNKKTGKTTQHEATVPPRSIFWLGKAQKERYREWTKEYLEMKSLRSR